MSAVPSKLENVFQLDPYLRDFGHEICRRYSVFQDYSRRIDECGGMESFTQGYKEFGLLVQPDNSIKCLEWAPGADGLALIGDFNNWNREAHRYTKEEHGKWSLVIPAKADGSCPIAHGSCLKVSVTKNGKTDDKISPWAQFVTRPKDSIIYQQEFYNPTTRYTFQHAKPTPSKSLRIYEAHVGISSPEGKVNTYRAFADEVLPRIKHQGYNAVQLMAVMEHVYYASFGYQVTNFFAASSRFGTPDELKYLVDKAHSLGISMFLDVVHSHASKNVADGLNEWDGTPGGYFHNNARGFHSLWDSRLFDYTQIETLRFLLSNLRWWVDEYGFDGFRFDGVTSMIYHSHGINDDFSGGYKMYFGLNADTDSLIYLMLANDFLHRKYPNIITIAEEVSGMPALCRPVEEGGQGFDMKLAMAVPDMWIKILKHQQDEDWKVGDIVFTLENRRYGENHVVYAESHDQALVGDKTLAFWMMDKEMYDFMSCISPLTPIIDRGIALHKLIRLLTIGLGGEAWLNFIGNEFGHPEWLDFPREGNQESFHYCRRQFNLVDDELLRYKFLNNWDRAVNNLEEKTGFLHKGPAYVSWKHDSDKVVCFERAGLLFVFNFHPSSSFPDYKVGVDAAGTYRVVLNSDNADFGGHSRIEESTEYKSYPYDYAGRRNHVVLYIPCRTAIVLARDP
ncbi:unnamed protein product [Auanema sp. JU1783]|nr:unnamed protein product [Auanema sp. JU1783]